MMRERERERIWIYGNEKEFEIDIKKTGIDSCDEQMRK